HFVDDNRDCLQQSPFNLSQKAACAWLLWYLEQQDASNEPWSKLIGWRLLGSDVQQCEVAVEGEALCLHYSLTQDNRADIRIDSESFPLQWRRQHDGMLELRLGNQRITLG